MSKVFVPYDFSENAANTVVYAVQLALKTGSDITVFHALTIPAKVMASEENRNDAILAEEAAKTDELRTEVLNLIAGTQLPIAVEKLHFKVSFGPIIVENIIYSAEDDGADLIVMGTHGATGLKKFLFGSVTSSTISKSNIPVLAIPEGFKYADVKRIAYASDLENFEPELQRILPFSESCNAVVEIIYFNYGFDKHIEAAGLLDKYTGNKVELVVKKADSSITLLNQIKKYITEEQPQWVVMFTRERSMWDKLFMGSKTEEMATGLQIPLLSFKKDI